MPAAAADGVFLSIVVFGALLVVVGRQLRSAPRGTGLALVGIVAFGAAVRLGIAIPAPMNAWSYVRTLPLADAIWTGPVLADLAAVLGLAPHFVDVVSWTNFACSVVTPVAYFAHARYLLRDHRSALLAAALIAILPMHVRFARSDVQFVMSLLGSSLTFVALYAALAEPSRSIRWAATALVPIASVATYSVRPENLAFYALDLAALALYLRAPVPRARLATVAALLTCAAGYSAVTHLLPLFGSQVRAGLSAQTLLWALRTAIDPVRNTLVNPWMTPPGVVALSALGAVLLVRRGERARVLFLVGWLATFFGIESSVHPSAPAMQARYHLHLVTPVVLLAAAAGPWLAARSRRAQLLCYAYLASAPFVHLGFERDVDYSDMQEWAFLRRALAEVPRGCTVLEPMPAISPAEPSRISASRVARLSTVLRDGQSTFDVRAVQLAELPAPSPDLRQPERVTAEAAKLLADPPACLMLYEGLACRTHHPPGTDVAPACEDAKRVAELDLVESATFVAHAYDDPISGPFLIGPNGETRVTRGVEEGTPVTVALWRVRPRSPLLPAGAREPPPGADR